MQYLSLPSQLALLTGRRSIGRKLIDAVGMSRNYSLSLPKIKVKNKITFDQNIFMQVDFSM